MEAHLPKISVVTVAYNAEATIEKTIKSVLAQTYPNLEYLIIDGNSKDQTMSIVQKYEESIDFILSEPDRNNYDAMNKGFKHATGDYIWFLHAGDVAYSPETLSLAFQNHNEEDFVYGKVKIVTAQGQDRPWHKAHPAAKNLSWKTFRNGMVICHQAMLIHRRCWVEYNALKYPLVGDLDWTIRTLQKAQTVRDAGVFFCTFLEGGISAKRRRKSLLERMRILAHYFGWPATLWEHVRIAGQAIRRGTIKN